jgi:iron complex outermembrane receptor protein
MRGWILGVRTRWRLVSALPAGLLAVSLAVPAQAQKKPTDLTEKSLEDLMNLEVTSVSKREQKLSRAAAAIYVITQEDIRRSGATSIPDLLRVVPGLEVAQIDANKWAISARGFNSRFANKMLVLIDGRTVYSPLFSGVFWDVQDALLEDIDRIEVIRGPGATLWGANAVNGVINIITKPARDTQGGLVTAGGGNQVLGFGAVRYGGAVGARGYYRAFVKYFNRNREAGPSGRSAADPWDMLRGGFRSDWQLSPRDSLTVEGNLYGGTARQTLTQLVSLMPPFTRTFNDQTTIGGGDVLARWARNFSGGSGLALQATFDRTTRDEAIFGENRNTFDLDFQHNFTWGNRQGVVWGLGYRSTSDHFGDRFLLDVDPERRRDQLFSAFLQDEIALVTDRIYLTLGSKFEHNDYTSFEAQPSIRLLWIPRTGHVLWGAVSRAVRSPSRAEDTVKFGLQAFPGPGGLPAVVTVFGNTALRSEDLLAYELGYRVQPRKSLSLDLTAFYNLYQDLVTGEQGVPFLKSHPAPHLAIPLVFENKMHGNAHGLELAGNWSVRSNWKLGIGYTWLEEMLMLDPTSNASTAPLAARDNPNHQAHLRSQLNLPHSVEFDSTLYFVGRLAHPQVSSYTRLDARLAWRPAEALELSAVVQNAFKDLHQEFFSTGLGENASFVRRSAYGKFTWRF